MGGNLRTPAIVAVARVLPGAQDGVGVCSHLPADVVAAMCESQQLAQGLGGEAQRGHVVDAPNLVDSREFVAILRRAAVRRSALERVLRRIAAPV